MCYDGKKDRICRGFFGERVTRVNKTELIERVAELTGVSRGEIRKVLNASFESIVEGMSQDGKVSLPGFGVFEVRSRRTYTGHNPRTGEDMEFGALCLPAFRPAQEVREKVRAAGKILQT